MRSKTCEAPTARLSADDFADAALGIPVAVAMRVWLSPAYWRSSRKKRADVALGEGLGDGWACPELGGDRRGVERAVPAWLPWRSGGRSAEVRRAFGQLSAVYHREKPICDGFATAMSPIVGACERLIPHRVAGARPAVAGDGSSGAPAARW